MKKVTIVLSFAALFIAACSGGSTNTTATETATTVDATTPEATTTEAAAGEIVVPADINELLTKNTCLTCHNANEKVVGPAYVEVAKRNYTAEQIVELIYKPKPSNWPDYQTPMVGLPNVPKEEALKIANWIISLK
ncbi:MAG: c-type cytochrome [Bacteroidia bacterium]